MKKWEEYSKKWKEYSNQHPTRAGYIRMASLCLGIFVFTQVTWFNMRIWALKTVREQAQAVGLENVRTEISKPSERGMAFVTLRADKPKSMSMKDLHEILLEIKAKDEDSTSWEIDWLYINGNRCYVDDEVMEWDGRAVYKTTRYKNEEKQEITEGKPYVGMEVKYIEKTSLGKADRIEFDEERTENGGEVYYTVYTWYEDDGHTVFTAKVEGHDRKDNSKRYKVLEVEEYEQKPKSSYSYSYTPSSGQSGDKYNAKKYTTAEDFYDDNYDNFFSYEDAESYYNKHK